MVITFREEWRISELTPKEIKGQSYSPKVNKLQKEHTWMGEYPGTLNTAT